MAMAEAPSAMGGFGPGSGGDPHVNFSSARQGAGLYEVFMKTKGDVHAVAEAGAEDSITYSQEFNTQRAIIPFEYTIRNKRFTNKGRTLDDINDVSGAGGDRLMRVKSAEKMMVENPLISQAVVASDDLGFDRSYLYVYTRDKEDGNKISAVAIEHQGTSAEFAKFFSSVGERSTRKTENNSPASFDSPLFFTADTQISLPEVFGAAARSYESPERQKEMQPFLDRLSRDAYGFNELVEQREREKARLTKAFEQEAQKLLEDRDTRTALGLVGQSVAAVARSLDLDTTDMYTRRSEETTTQDDRRVRDIAIPREESRQNEKIEEVKEPQVREEQARTHTNPYNLRNLPRRHRGHSGGRGFRSQRWKEQFKLAGGIDLIVRKGKLQAEEVGKKLASQGKKKKQEEVFLFHEEPSLPDSTENTPQFETKITASSLPVRTDKEGANSEHIKQPNLVEPQIRQGNDRVTVSRKDITPITLYESIPEQKSKPKSPFAGARAHIIASVLPRESTMTSKRQKKTGEVKSRQNRLPVELAKRESGPAKKLGEIKRRRDVLDSRDIIKRRQIRQISRSLRMLRAFEGIGVVRSGDKASLLNARKRKELLSIARLLWGKDSLTYKKLEKGAISPKTIIMLRGELVLRLKQLKREFKGEKRIGTGKRKEKQILFLRKKTSREQAQSRGKNKKEGNAFRILKRKRYKKVSSESRLSVPKGNATLFTVEKRKRRRRRVDQGAGKSKGTVLFEFRTNEAPMKIKPDESLFEVHSNNITSFERYEYLYASQRYYHSLHKGARQRIPALPRFGIIYRYQGATKSASRMIASRAN